MTNELASLEFLVDELILEPDTPRGQACAKQIYLHAHRGEDLGAHAARLRAVTFADHVVQRNVGWALAAWAYRRDDGALVRELLAGPHALATLQLDHRERVGRAVIEELVRFAERADDEHRNHAFRALDRLVRHEADLAPALPLLVSALGTPARGRGHKRVDLDAMARATLTIAATNPSFKVTLVDALTRLGADKGKPASSARELLAALSA